MRKVIAASPNFARAHLALGKALLQDGKVPEAITELQEAARLDPQSGEAHYQLGLALSRAGRKDEAGAELKQGRELSSADDRTQNVNLDIAEGRAALDKGDLGRSHATIASASISTTQLGSSSADDERRTRHRADVLEHLTVSAADLVAVVRVSGIDARAHDVRRLRADLVERRDDDLEATLGLLVRIGRRRRPSG